MKTTKSSWEFPDFLKPEFKNLEKRLDKAIEWAEKNSNEIHPSISFTERVQLYDMGIDVTQLLK